MNVKNSKPLELKVHLAGAIAYVHKDDALWALHPNGQLATPARWRIEEESEFLEARSTHLPFLLVDHEIVDRKKTSIKINTILEPWDSSSRVFVNSLFPLTPSRKILTQLLGCRLDFGFSDKKLKINSDVKKFFPQMKEIEPYHAWADRHYDPEGSAFKHKEISSALRLNAGVLSVGSFFDQAKMSKVKFAYVVVDADGSVKFEDPVWNRPVANHLIWTVPLEAGVKKVEIKFNSLVSDESLGVLSLRVPQNRNSIEVAILHSEPELPALFVEDPALPSGTLPLPDPDFELIHAIAVGQTKKSRLRVPVNKSSSAGGKEKPCTGGMYEGFK